MALGNRALNERKLTDVYAGLPRNLNTELAAKTVARLKVVFSLQATPKARAKHQINEHRSKAFNTEVTGAGAPAEGTKSATLLASGSPPG